jgi:hypothetical protein
MSPTPANDFAPEVSLADLLTQAADLQRQIDAVEAARAAALASRLRDHIAIMEGPAFGPAVHQLAAETARACAFPTDQEASQ